MQGRGLGAPKKEDLDLLRWQLCLREGRPPNAPPSSPTPGPCRNPGPEAGSRVNRGSPLWGGVAQGQLLPVSEPLFPFCSSTLGGSEEAAWLGRAPSCGHGGGGCGRAGRGRAGGRGVDRNYSGLPSSRTQAPEAPTANDHPVCQAKVFPVPPAARLNLPTPPASPSQKPPLLGHLGSERRTPCLAPAAPLTHPIPPAQFPTAQTRVRIPRPRRTEVVPKFDPMSGLAQSSSVLRTCGRPWDTAHTCWHAASLGQEGV